MCPPQTIPPIDRIERLQNMLAAAEETSEEGQDIYALDGTTVGSNDQIVESMNYLTSTFDITNVEENLLNHGRIQIPYSLPSDYEDIFKLPALSRRSARPINNVDLSLVSADQVILVEHWAELCLDNPSKDVDYCLPGDMTAFEALMEYKEFPLATFKDCFCEWQPRFGSEHVQYRRRADGKIGTTTVFMGEAQQGRLVWAPVLKSARPIGLGGAFVREMEKTIKLAEAALIALARRVARHVATSIVYQYAEPKADERGYDILSTKQIVSAVREILGEEWFDLPFDVDGKLRKWGEEDVWDPVDENI